MQSRGTGVIIALNLVQELKAVNPSSGRNRWVTVASIFPKFMMLYAYVQQGKDNSSLMSYDEKQSSLCFRLE